MVDIVKQDELDFTSRYFLEKRDLLKQIKPIIQKQCKGQFMKKADCQLSMWEKLPFRRVSANSGRGHPGDPAIHIRTEPGDLGHPFWVISGPANPIFLSSSFPLLPHSTSILLKFQLRCKWLSGKNHLKSP